MWPKALIFDLGDPGPQRQKLLQPKSYSWLLRANRLSFPCPVLCTLQPKGVTLMVELTPCLMWKNRYERVLSHFEVFNGKSFLLLCYRFGFCLLRCKAWVPVLGEHIIQLVAPVLFARETTSGTFSDGVRKVASGQEVSLSQIVFTISLSSFPFSLFCKLLI